MVTIRIREGFLSWWAWTLLADKVRIFETLINILRREHGLLIIEWETHAPLGGVLAAHELLQEAPHLLPRPVEGRHDCLHTGVGGPAPVAGGARPRVHREVDRQQPLALAAVGAGVDLGPGLHTPDLAPVPNCSVDTA